MRFRRTLLSLVVGVLGASPLTASAQLTDLISEINGDNGFQSNTQKRYFNRLDCGLPQQGETSATGGTGGAGGAGGAGGTGGAGGSGGTGGSLAFASPKGSPEETTFQIRLDNSGGSITQVFLWVGGQGAGCNVAENRNQTNARCAEIAGNPYVVGSNFLVDGLTLQDLLNALAGSTQIVTCDSSGLQGTPYEIYAFRNTAPGGGDIDASNYGIAPFYVDVEPPAPPNVNTTPQSQTNFNITWANPDPPDLIQQWAFYASYGATPDPANAEPLGITAGLSDFSKTISAVGDLGLSVGESAFVYVAAYDQAFVSVDNVQQQANLSELSNGVPVTYVEVGGFCDTTGDCSGCSASPMVLPNGEPSEGLWMLGLLLASLAVWRLRR